MNLNSNPEVSQLEELISKCDDENFNHIIWVAKNGTVHIYANALSNPIQAFENENGKNLQFWKGIYNKGDHYFGPEASKDSKYVQDLYDNLMRKWKNKIYGHIDD